MLRVLPYPEHLQKQFLPRELSTAATELDYLAGPQGIGVQGVILDCPAVAAAWLQSHDWCTAVYLQSTRSPNMAQQHILFSARTAGNAAVCSGVCPSLALLPTVCHPMAFAAVKQIADNRRQPFIACRAGTAPRLQAPAGTVGAATGQTAGVDSSGSVFELSNRDAVLGALVAAGALAAWLWLRRRHSAKRCAVHFGLLLLGCIDAGRRQSVWLLLRLCIAVF